MTVLEWQAEERKKRNVRVLNMKRAVLAYGAYSQPGSWLSLCVSGNPAASPVYAVAMDCTVPGLGRADQEMVLVLWQILTEGAAPYEDGAVRADKIYRFQFRVSLTFSDDWRMGCSYLYTLSK